MPFVFKNWSPLIEKSELFFVTSIVPLQVIGPCQEFIDHWNCSKISHSDFKNTSTFSDVQILRGGSSFHRFDTSLYFSLAHTNNYPSNLHRPVLVLLVTNPSYKVFILPHFYEIEYAQYQKGFRVTEDPVSILRMLSNGSLLISLAVARTQAYFHGVVARSDCLLHHVRMFSRACSLLDYNEDVLRLILLRYNTSLRRSH